MVEMDNIVAQDIFLGVYKLCLVHNVAKVNSNLPIIF